MSYASQAYRIPASPHALPGVTVSLRRIRLDRYGYDAEGCYYGIGLPLWSATSDCGTVDLEFRATSRDAARRVVLADYPGCIVRR